MAFSYSKEFDMFFNLDPKKLEKLIKVIESRLDDNYFEFNRRFIINDRKGRVTEFKKLSDVLDFDNTKESPIEKLKIKYRNVKEDYLNLEINFSNIYIENSNDYRSKVSIYFDTKVSIFGNDLCSDIEEQIERVRISDFSYLLKNETVILLNWFCIILVSYGLLLYLSNPGSHTVNKLNDYLLQEDIEVLGKKMNDIVEDREKIDFLFEYHSRRLQNLEKERAGESVNIVVKNSYNKKFIRNCILILIINCGIFFVSKLCIGSIFLWGDMPEVHKRMSSFRSLIVFGVGLAFLVTVFGNIFTDI